MKNSGKLANSRINSKKVKIYAQPVYQVARIYIKYDKISHAELLILE